MNITRPTGMALHDWADQIVFDLSSSGLAPRLDNDDWQAWGISLRNSIQLGQTLPDPYVYSTWPEWAQRFCEVLS